MMSLRPYQEELVEDGVRYVENGGRAGVLVAPTGSGKSHVIAALVERISGRVVVFQPSKEILTHNAAKLVAAGQRTP